VRGEIKRLYNRKLFQEYSYKNYENLLQVTIENVRDVFEIQCTVLLAVYNRQLFLRFLHFNKCHTVCCNCVQVISFLSDLYNSFDSIIDKYDIYKVVFIPSLYSFRSLYSKLSETKFQKTCVVNFENNQAYC